MNKDLIERVTEIVRDAAETEGGQLDEHTSISFLCNPKEVAISAISAIIPEGSIVVQGWQDITEDFKPDRGVYLFRTGLEMPTALQWVPEYGFLVDDIGDDYTTDCFTQYMPIPKGVGQ